MIQHSFIEVEIIELKVQIFKNKNNQITTTTRKTRYTAEKNQNQNPFFEKTKNSINLTYCCWQNLLIQQFYAYMNPPHTNVNTCSPKT